MGFASLGLSFAKLGLSLLGIIFTVWFAPPKRVWQGKWSVLSRVQLIHLGISLGLIVNQLLILVDILLHLMYVYSCQWQYSDQGLVYLSQCTHSFLDIRQELLVDPIMKCSIFLFNLCGALLIFYAKEKYTMMILPIYRHYQSLDRRPHRIAHMLQLNPLKLRLLCYFGLLFGFWMCLSHVLVDIEGGSHLAIKISNLASALLFCSHIIASVGWIEMKLAYSLLEELELETTAGSRTSAYTRMTNYVKVVSNQEKFKLISYVLAILLLGSGGTVWYVWANWSHTALMNYYNAMGQSLGTVLINMILYVLTLLHSAHGRLRESALDHAQRKALRFTSALGSPTPDMTSSVTSSELLQQTMNGIYPPFNTSTR